MNESNPQDPKEPTSYQKEQAKTDEKDYEYSEGVDDLTIRFLKTKHRATTLFKMASKEISMRFFTTSDRDMLFNANEQDDESEDEESEDEEKVPNAKGYQTIKEKKEKWYEQEPDETLEEMMAGGTLVVVVGFLAGCGFLGYLSLKWLG